MMRTLFRTCFRSFLPFITVAILSLPFLGRSGGIGFFLHLFGRFLEGMIQWKQRLYAFLLRRVLGPFLDESSTKKLHDSIDFSFQEGKFVLKDVFLSPGHLSEIIAPSGFAVRKATVRRLEICLALRDNDETTQSSSLAWRAMKLGGTPAEEDSSRPAVSLVADISVQGIELELVPLTPDQKTSRTRPKPEPTTEPSITKGRIATYVDAALSSLLMTLRLSDVSLKLVHEDHWLELILSSLLYKDFELNSGPAEAKTVLNKTVDLSDIRLRAGSTNIFDIAMARGNGRIFLKIVDQSLTSPSEKRCLSQDVEARLNYQTNVSIDVALLENIQKIYEGIVVARSLDLESEFGMVSLPPRGGSQATYTTSGNDETIDEADLKAITGIMKQYKEAYHLVETHQLRGGIMIPSSDGLDSCEEEDDITFDVFFDANDQSFYNAASTLRESIAIQNDDSMTEDSVNQRLRLSLLSGCFKINFRNFCPGSDHREYVLLSFDELNISLSSSTSHSELTVDCATFEIEDAQLESKQRGGSFIDRGSLLRFTAHDADSAANEETVVVSQIHCISAHITTKVDVKKKTKSYDCCVDLLPIEMTSRLRTLTNLGRFSESLKRSLSCTESRVESRSSEHQAAWASFECSCPSLTVVIPLQGAAPTASLFSRCGEILDDAPVREPSLGVHFDSIMLEWKHAEPTTLRDEVETSAKIIVAEIIVFACAPSGDRLSVGTQMERVDLALIQGRNEIDPSIPLSMEYKKSKARAIYYDSFPVVPSISSFKARQEDDDDDDELKYIFSGLDGTNRDLRDNLRGADPQIAMLQDAEKAQQEIAIRVPEIFVDLTRTELAKTIEMLGMVKTLDSVEKSSENPTEAEENDVDPTSYINVALHIDQISLSLKEDFRIEDLYSEVLRDRRFSCILMMDEVCAYTLINSRDAKNARFFCHDICFYTATHSRIDSEIQRSERSARTRANALKKRFAVYPKSKLTPVFYRSKIFSPICQEAPSILVDMRHLNPNGKNSSQRRLYLTFYHLTLRYDVDTSWVAKVRNLLPPGASDRGNNKQASNAVAYNLGTFVSITDCNIDYSTPSFLPTRARSIIRVGDCRLSSNIVVPAPKSQAFTLSLGDVSCNICNERVSYVEEDGKLCRARVLYSSEFVDLGTRARNMMKGAARDFLLDKRFIEIVGLDCMDGVIVAVNDELGREGKGSASCEARISIVVTLGLLQVNSCKDSFNCFASTIGELQAWTTSYTDGDILDMRKTMKGKQNPANDRMSESPNCSTGKMPETFLLDGYEWTEVGQAVVQSLEIPDGDEQVAKWYRQPIETHGSHTVDNLGSDPKGPPFTIIQHHFPLHSPSTFILDGHAKADSGNQSLCDLKSSIIVKKASIKVRCYDGYDWPESPGHLKESAVHKKKYFAIEGPNHAEKGLKEKEAGAVPSDHETGSRERLPTVQRSKNIMDTLLDCEDDTVFGKPTFEIPLPEDRAQLIRKQIDTSRLARKSNLYLQVSAIGVSVRLVAFETSSTVQLSIKDFFVAETTNRSNPVKMLGEWLNESEHPRDSRQGAVMLKMTTWKPSSQLTPENKIASDSYEATMQFLPMRAIIDQRAIRFATLFFDNKANNDAPAAWQQGLHLVPPPRIKSLRVKAWKLKVDYIPKTLDVNALRDGCLVQLINVSPIDGMIITLTDVLVREADSLGDAMSVVTERWLQEVVSTQLHKFLANARPFEPISDVGKGVGDLIVLPYEAFKNGDDIRSAMRLGLSSLAETVAFQALTTTSRLTEYAASKMSAVVSGRHHHASWSSLPARPTAAPRGVQDVTGHAMKSLAKGVQAANYKIVIVPYREYTRSGASGAVTSVLRGIPVMLIAPVTGATEALSYTLLGARNALRPDIRREEEASRTGFIHYD